MIYLIAINNYRSSTSDGKQRNRILREGLPTNDAWYTDNEGRRQPCCSTRGVRVVTPSECRKAIKYMKIYGTSTIGFVGYYHDQISN